MWTLISFITLLGLCCAVSTTPPSPINAGFTSVNLRNVLQWSPGNGTPDDTHFTVEYAIYGDSIEGSKGRRVHWRAVRQCMDIIRTWCDLTTETWDVEHGYHARVRATSRRSSSRWALTRRFDPKSDTTFGPPLVSLEIENNSVIISLKGPMRYPANNHTPQLSMAAVYPHMSYNLSIHNRHRNQMHHFPVATSPYRYQLLDYNTEYCFSAKPRFLSMPVRCQASAWHCITTPQDPMIEHLQKVVVGIVVPSLCICIIMVVGYFLYNYLTGRGQKSPFMLKPPSFHPPPLTLPPDNLNLFLISIIKDERPSDPPCPEPQPGIADPPPSYLSQRPETPVQPEEPRDDLSVDYGAVAVAPVVNQEEAREMEHDEGDCGNSLMGEHQRGADSGNRGDQNDDDGIHAPQGNPYLSQRKTYTCKQTQREGNTLVQARPWTGVSSALPTQTQAQLQHCHQSVTAKLNAREEGGEFPGLFIRKIPQTGLFNVLPTLQTHRDEEEQGEVAGKIDGSEEERSENVPLLSAYARQNAVNMPMCHPDQPDCLSDDYGLLEAGVVQETEDHFVDEEEEGANCINWDPETGKLVLPEMEMGFMNEEGLNGAMHSESRRDDRVAGENEMYVSRVQLQLESVFVRQTSEEEEEAQRVLERGGDVGWEVDDVLTEWGLVIPTDQ